MSGLVGTRELMINTPPNKSAVGPAACMVCIYIRFTHKCTYLLFVNKTGFCETSGGSFLCGEENVPRSSGCPPKTLCSYEPYYVRSTNATNCTAASYQVILKWPFYQYSRIGPRYRLNRLRECLHRDFNIALQATDRSLF